MFHISQSIDGNTVTFSANDPAADLWMRAVYYDQHTVTFRLPNEVEAVKAFRTGAEENGFTVG